MIKAIESPGATVVAELNKALDGYILQSRYRCLRETTIRHYSVQCSWFLQNLSLLGCTTVTDLTTNHIIKACNAMKSPEYFSSIRGYLTFLAEENYTAQDFSFVVPKFRRSNPVPSVYTHNEIVAVEMAIQNSGGETERNYAVLLLATRLGMRGGDIATLRLKDIDFRSDVIRKIQQKTGLPLELPIIVEVKTALQNYINNSRPKTESPFVFLFTTPPYDKITSKFIGKITARGLKLAGVVVGERKQGPHAFRSSLASSMVNDDVPYDAVRRVLGHWDPNAIKHYAKLDIERLRMFSLPVPEASGTFADFLAGRKKL